ncbi:unannotated protein [freshwater metagenome]|uniref:Unannotated protein n=1 Tax=freshwater metagenome TaxID=449393 RepID=A0A6J6V1C1_9ZZZZ
MGLLQPSQELRHQPTAGGTNDTKASVTRNDVIKGRDVGGDVIKFPQDPPTPFNDKIALVGDLTRGSVNQGDPEFLLETGNVGRHIGLHRKKCLGGCRKGSMIGDCHEG